MTRRPPRRTRDSGDEPGQLLIAWSNTAPARQTLTPPAVPADEPPVLADPLPPPRETGLVLSLPWDFRTTFPEPTQEAIDAGILAETDLDPAALRSLHQEHARHALAALRDLDTVLDARRRGIDPKTGQPPATEAASERLQKLFATEPDRLQRWWQSLMDSYESGFGPDAADAFAKAIQAWHAGVEVIADRRPVTETHRPTPISPPELTPPNGEPKNARPPTLPPPDEGPGATDFPAPTSSKPLPKRRRVVACLPVPKPLPAAVAAGHFGKDDVGPIHPSPDEVRAITENHAERIIDLLDGLQQVERTLAASQCSDRARLYHERDALLCKVGSAVARYAEDFGPDAADQLEAYARRQAALRTRPANETRGR